MSAESATPVCARHPDREAYVSCQRCGNRVCPECQTPAAVGVVCPDCLAASRNRSPRIKQSRLSRSPAPVTVSLVAVCAAVWVVQLIPDLGVTEWLAYAGLYSTPGAFEPWRMVTSAFVHSTASLFHILLNMYTLWIFGRLLEPTIGSGRFVTLYLLAAWGGSVGMLWLGDPRVPVVGASGAIFGVIGAFIVIHRSLGGSTPQLYVLLGINLVIGFLPGMNVAWQAHLGGLVTGALIGFVFVRTRYARTHHTEWLSVAAVAAALLLASLRFVLFA